MNARLMRTMALAGALALSGVALAAPDKAADPHAPAGGAAAAAHDHAAGQDAHHEAEPSLFVGGLGNAIITLIIFGIVVIVLGKTAWPKILAGLEERERSIRESLEAARREREEAAVLLKKHQAAIDQSRAEASAIVEEGRRDGEATRRRLAEEAQREADEMIARARREIQLATDGAIKELYDKTADLSVRIAGAIVHKSLSADDHRALVRESIERMTATQDAKRN